MLSRTTGVGPRPTVGGIRWPYFPGVVAALVCAATIRGRADRPTDACAQAPVTSPRPTVARVEVIPNVVMVQVMAGAPTTFSLAARLWGPPEWGYPDGTIITESYGYAPCWTTSDTRIVTTSKDQHRATFSIDPTAGSPPWDATVTVEIGGQTGAAQIKVIDPSVGDRIQATHPDGAPPEVALVEGRLRAGSSDCLKDERVVALVRMASVGDLTGPCEGTGAVALSYTDKAFLIRGGNWSGGSDLPGFLGQEHAPVPLPVAVWVAVTPPDVPPEEIGSVRNAVRDRAVLDVSLANAILESERAGVRITLLSGFPTIVSEDDPLTVFGKVCDDADAIPASYVQTAFLNIYYVDDFSGLRGVLCARTDPRPHDVIYVGRLAAVSTTLAHELGHSFGLLFPYDGHTNLFSKFDPTNVMYGQLDPSRAANRDQLTLGQVFRMNADDWSWVNHAVTAPGGPRVRSSTEPTFPCQCDPYVKRPCPRLIEDMPPVENRDTPIDAWECADRVDLLGTDEAYSGVGLLAGREWRSEACQVGLLAQPSRPSWAHELYLLSPENLTTPAGSVACESWLAVFLKEHAMMFVRPPPDKWNYLINEWQLSGADAELVAVPFHVWFVPTSAGTDASATLRTLADADTATANKLYNTNLAGLTLQPIYETAPANGSGICAMDHAAAGEINVYYVPVGHALGSQQKGYCPPKRNAYGSNTYLIMVPAASHCSTLLAHRMGHVLALGDVIKPAGGLGNTNIMWDPNGKGTSNCASRQKLSLGQVFRMNVDVTSWLNASGKYPGRQTVACAGSEVAKCPALTARVPD